MEVNGDDLDIIRMRGEKPEIWVLQLQPVIVRSIEPVVRSIGQSAATGPIDRTVFPYYPIDKTVPQRLGVGIFPL